jgi:serralysin
MAVYASTNTLARYLTSGYYSDTNQSRYSWDTSNSDVVTVNLGGLTDAGKALARKALAAFEAVVDLDFRETSGGGDIVFTDNSSHQVGRYLYTSPITGTYQRGGDLQKAEVNIPKSWQDRHGTDVGDYGFQLYLHEIAHALGLGHLGTYNGGADWSDAKFTTDSWMQSVQSYFNQTENPNVDAPYGHVLTPMMADILALQMLYGRQKDGPTAGDTVYGVGSDLGTYLDKVFRGSEGSMKSDFMVVYDASGRDTLDFSNDTANQKVTLKAGTFSDTYGRVDNIGIAVGTVIENYTAGSGNDQITGNGVANTLRGGAGNDQIAGGSGNDRLYGGEGADTLTGGAGNDLLDGGAGSDQFVLRSGSDTVVRFEDNVDTLRLDDALWGGGRTIAQVLDLAQTNSSGDLVFNFSGTQELVIRGLTDKSLLLDDIVIV